MKHLTGEKWLIRGGREVVVVKSMKDGFIIVLNEVGKLEQITEAWLVQRI